jgi:hypothetical protein
MLIAIASLKASPGVTTTALALAGFWPTDAPTAVLETDPAGGDIKSWQRLPGDPGLVAMATAARHQTDPATLAAHASTLPGGLSVVTAPERADHAAAAVGLLARDGGGLLRSLSAADAVTIADLGRLDTSSPALPILGYADVVLLVVRPHLAEITRMVAGIGAVKDRARKDATVGVVLVGDGYSTAQVEESLETTVFGHLPQDATCAGVLAGRLTVRRGLGRSVLSRHARSLGSTLIDARRAAAPLLEVPA